MESRRPSGRPLPLVSLLGPSGSGKSTLACALVRRWTAAGLRVGYVKHASHGFEVDRPGKDSDRVADAGAAGVALIGPGGFAYLERGEPWDPADAIERCFSDRDAVVLEGFRQAGYPSVVLAGDGKASTAAAEARGPIIALVIGCDGRAAAEAASRGAPVFARDDTDGLALAIEQAITVSLRVPSEATQSTV